MRSADMDTPGKVSAGRAGIVAAVVLVLACAGPPEFDLVIRGGDVYDGSSQPPQRADVGIKGDRITAVGHLGDRRAGQIIAAVKKADAPGFTDPRGRSGITLPADGTAASPIRQGPNSAIIA